MGHRRKEFLDQSTVGTFTASERSAPGSYGSLSDEQLEEIRDDVIAGRVLTIKDLQKNLKCSYETVRKEVLKEPGVIQWGDPRIPYCVLKNILKRLTRSDQRC